MTKHGISDKDDRDAGRRRRLWPIEAPVSLTQRAAQLIREEVLSGRTRPGEHLVEAVLATQLQISRGTVREALTILRAEGLIREEPRRGSFVVSLGPSDVEDIFEVRAAVEGRAAKRLAARGDAAAYLELQRRLAELADVAKGGDVAAVSHLDMEFHEAICRLSGNSRLLSAYSANVPAIRMLFALDRYLHRSPTDIAEMHRPIVDAIVSGQAELAQQLCVEHCESAVTVALDYLKAHPALPDE